MCFCAVVRLLALAFVLSAFPLPAAGRAVDLRDAVADDVRRFSQRPSDYLFAFSRPWVDAEEQKRLSEAVTGAFFSPWSGEGRSDAESMMAGASDFFTAELWGANLRPIDAKRREAISDEADLGSFPSMLRCAIIVSDTDCRVFPTELPAFGDPDAAGEGFPFDYMQNSRFRVGTPVLVRHESRGGGWLFVEGAHFSGWVKRRDAAFAGVGFMRGYDTGDMAAIVSDGTALRDSRGRFLAQADVGSLFPVAGRAGDSLVLNVPLRGGDGRARVGRAVVPRSDAAEFPLAFNAANVARLADALRGSAYGWGGLFGGRDCSQFLQELYLPFGIPLPRNSAAQREAFPSFDVSRLSPEDKLSAVRSLGTPFRTLLALRGHIGVYVGTRGGVPLMMHCSWGVPLDEGGAGGRLLFGGVVITSLRPGKELPRVDEDVLLDKLEALVFLPGAGHSGDVPSEE